MKTRCKFKCNEIVKSLNCGETVYNAKFSAVHSGSPENDEFFKWTPSGTLIVGIYADDRFDVGKEYYIDIVPCEEQVGAPG